ncbi:hypothetical protein [Polyangium spumosum]|uniref:Uncharacterized protein n=1 Tax=Polyangium spumosum TaxID=889282 RepID=A0A6N7PLW9_9BACT|nr:hypothetical protein [Polyangium spumosum]MRG93063.1 hypothetical protein [Polyangium spumosum]
MSAGARAELDSRGTSHAATSPANSLDQVREILFGAFVRDFERKLARIEGLVAAQGEELRADTKRMVGVLEAHVKRETDAHSTQQQADRAAQMTALNNVAREARDAIAELDQRIKKLEDGLIRAQRDFRQQILDEAKGFVEQTHSLREELMGTLQRELALFSGEASESVGPPSGVVEAPRTPEPRIEKP